MSKDHPPLLGVHRIVSCGSVMSEDAQKVWDDIAERNTQALEELMAMTPDERASLTCAVEDIPNPFRNCTSVSC